MKVRGKPVSTSVGVWFIGFGLINAAVILPHAKVAQYPVLFVCIFGGLFVGIPAVLGIGIVLENRLSRSRPRTKSNYSLLQNPDYTP